MKPLRQALLARLAPVLALLLPLAIVSLGVLLMAWDPLPLQGLRHKLFDQYQRGQPRVYVDSPVRIVDIDEESLKRLGQWPWPRSWLAELVNHGREAGALAIGLDMVFPEPDRSAPRAVLRQTQTRSTPAMDAKLREHLLSMPDPDTVLASAIAGGSVVLGYVVLAKGEPTLGPNQIAPFVQRGASSLASLYSFEGTLASLPTIGREAAGHGVMSFVADDDGVVRRVPLVLKLAGQPVPSLSAELLRVSQAAPSYVLTSAQASAHANAGLDSVQIGRLQVPTNEHGEVWVHYSASRPERYIPAWKLLAGELPAQALKGQVLLIGSSALGLMDLRFSPLGTIIPGVEVHAQALEQMLAGTSLVRPSWATALEILALLLAGLGVGLWALRARALPAAALTLAVIAALFASGWLAFSQYRVLLNPLTPSLFVLSSFVLCSLAHHFISERHQRWVTQAFSRYVSPNVVNYLVQHPEELSLGGSRRQCSFIFTDLQGFTRLLESMDPAQLVASLNTYLDGMFEIVLRHQGTLSRILGDGLHVVFSAPLVQPDHQQRAYDCALEMHQFAKQHAAQMANQGVQFGQTRIGVHCGEAIVGNVGGSHMFDYRALGDPVNTTSRLESVNRHLGTQVCVSEALLAGCAAATARPVGRLRLSGKRNSLKVFEALDSQDALSRAPPARYQVAYDLLRPPIHPARIEAALACFEGLLLDYPNDPLLRWQRDRLRRGETGEEMVMTEK